LFSSVGAATPIADRRTIDPLFGDLAAFDALVEAVVELRPLPPGEVLLASGAPRRGNPRPGHGCLARVSYTSRGSVRVRRRTTAP
jgi:CRP-like cAMP-binding protein